MESIPLLYQIIFIIVINTIVVSLVAYLICKRTGRKVKSPISPTKLSETNKVKEEAPRLEKSEPEVLKQYQKPVPVVEKKDLSQEKQVKDKKKQKYLRYTPSGYINIEDDKDKKKSKWR